MTRPGKPNILYLVVLFVATDHNIMNYNEEKIAVCDDKAMIDMLLSLLFVFEWKKKPHPE